MIAFGIGSSDSQLAHQGPSRHDNLVYKDDETLPPVASGFNPPDRQIDGGVSRPPPEGPAGPAAKGKQPVGRQATEAAELTLHSHEESWIDRILHLIGPSACPQDDVGRSAGFFLDSFTQLCSALG